MPMMIITIFYQLRIKYLLSVWKKRDVILLRKFGKRVEKQDLSRFMDRLRKIKIKIKKVNMIKLKVPKIILIKMIPRRKKKKKYINK